MSTTELKYLVTFTLMLQVYMQECIILKQEILLLMFNINKVYKYLCIGQIVSKYIYHAHQCQRP